MAEPELREALVYRIGVWAMNTVDARYDLDWDMTTLEEGELRAILREALDAIPDLEPPSEKETECGVHD